MVITYPAPKVHDLSSAESRIVIIIPTIDMSLKV